MQSMPSQRTRENPRNSKALGEYVSDRLLTAIKYLHHELGAVAEAPTIEQRDRLGALFVQRVTSTIYEEADKAADLARKTYLDPIAAMLESEASKLDRKSPFALELTRLAEELRDYRKE